NVLSIGFFSLDRNNTDRAASMTVTFLDNTTLTTSAPDADNTYFLGLSATGTNYIKSFSISQANFIRYDDFGFITASAIPEPSTYAIAAGGLALVGAMVSRRRQSKN
ncbi:MAG TPA: PEP-CTERM sorting domain-containing protein, partial [Roseimicrobium sp.]|nr:PEP-CTERM sorting domain-containing protein [Roseimicrobium sp.]